MSASVSEPGDAVRVEPASCIVCGADGGRPFATGRDYEYDTSEREFVFVECEGCGHVHLDPRPTFDSASAIYPAHYYALSGAHRSGALSLLGRVKDVVVTRRVRPLVSDVRPGGRVLEVGCGDGSLLLSIGRVRPDLRLVGIDLQFSGPTRHSLERQGVEVVEGALEETDFGEPLDMVIMNQLVEHLWEPRACLARVYEALRPGGILSISTPNLDGWDRRFSAAHAWGGYHIPRHLNLFTRPSLSRLLEQHGFRVVHTVDLVAPLIWVATAHNWLQIRGSSLHRMFRDTNLAAVAVATVVDWLAIRLGATTSNQQVIAVKAEGAAPSSPGRG